MTHPSDPTRNVFANDICARCHRHIDDHDDAGPRSVPRFVCRDDDDFCHRTDGACSGRACWTCDPNYFKENA